MPTIGDLIELGFTMSVHCPECGDHNVIDLEVVAAELGRGQRYVSGLALRCDKCGSRGVWTTIHPPEGLAS